MKQINEIIGSRLAILITVLVVVAIVILGLVFWPPEPPISPPPTWIPAFIAESERDDVFVQSENNENDQIPKPTLPLPAPNQQWMTVGGRVAVEDIGWAILLFRDLLKIDVLRDGETEMLETAVSQDQPIIIRLRHQKGAMHNNFDSEKAKDARLSIEIDPSNNNSKFVRVISTTATGTQFITAIEDDNPLVWVVALEAEPNDLSITLDDTGVISGPFGITSGFARWIAPVGPPSEPIRISIEDAEKWLTALRNGQLQTEIGDALWSDANASVNGDNFEEQNLTEIFRNQRVRVKLKGEEDQGFVEIILDPDLHYGDPAVPVELEDCNEDGLLDVPVRNNELLQIDFRLTTARVRNAHITVYNETERLTGSLRILDPAKQELSESFELLGAGPDEEYTFKPNSSHIFHYANLRMMNGCLLTLNILPPDVTEITPTPTPFPTDVPTRTPSPPIIIVTPTSTATPTPTPTGSDSTPDNGGPLSSTCPPPTGWVEYTVQVGDTLETLSNRTGILIRELYRLNCLTTFTIQPGQKIYLPFIPPTFTPTPTATATPTVTLSVTPPDPFTEAGPTVEACSPSFGRLGQVVPITCTGQNFIPRAQSFTVRLTGPEELSMEIQGGSDTSFQGVITNTTKVGMYDIIVTSNGRSGIKEDVFQVKAPDLIPVVFEAPTIVRPGEDITQAMQLVVRNQGDYPAEGFIIRTFISSDEAIGDALDEPLAPDIFVEGLAEGQQQTIALPPQTIPHEWPIGPAYLGVVVDALNQVVETEVAEDNNVARVQTEVIHPDLVITQFTGPAEAEPGQNIGERIAAAGQSMQLAIANQGTDRAGPFVIRTVISPDPIIDLADEQLGEFDIFIDGLEAAQELSDVPLGRQIIPIDWPAGPAYLGVMVDSGEDVWEDKEDNNIAFTPIEIIRLPDLVVSEFNGPSRAEPGEDISGDLSFTVQNIGLGPALGTLDSDTDNLAEDGSGYAIDLILSSDGNLPIQPGVVFENFQEDMLLLGGRTSRTNTLQPSQPMTYRVGATIPADTPPGTYCLGSVIDPFRVIAERSEFNNTYCHPIQIEALKPDLIVFDIFFTAASEAGYTLEVVVYNQEIVDVGNTFVIELFGDLIDPDIGTPVPRELLCTLTVTGKDLNTLNISSKITQTCFSTVLPNEFFAVVDPQNSVSEKNENNNSCTLSISDIQQPCPISD